MEYKDLEGLSWSQVRNFNAEGMPSPISVHVPINLPFSKELIYCDKAFNAYALPVPAGMRTRYGATEGMRDAMRVLLCSFAFGEPAFVPDFQLTKAWRKPGCPGEIAMTYYAWDLLYTLEYCADGGNNAWVRVTVENTDQKARPAHVRACLTRPRERAQFAYHYVPFAWDASSWLEEDSIRYWQGCFYDGKGQRGRALPGDFAMEYEPLRQFAPEEYNVSEFGCGRPYWVQHNFQLLTCRNTLHFSTELQPGEQKSFELVLNPEFDGPQAENYDGAVRENKAVWERLTGELTEVDFGDERENLRFAAIRNCIFQLLLDRGGQLQPCQGGSSERFFVWVWEAMYELRHMVALGAFDAVRRALEMLLSFQDGGVPPEGDFTTTEGAIGTTGPRWTNSTGSALTLVSEYLILSGDREFWARHGKDLIRAADWILGEVKATQVPGALNYGLMPKACATDGDVGYIYVTSDGFSWAGVSRFCRVLEAFGSPEHERVARATEEYRQNIHAAMERVSRPDGFIDRKLNDEGIICYGFRNIDSAMQLVECGCCSALDPHIARLIAYQENNCYRGPFCAPMNEDLNYVGNTEKVMMECYIRRGEYKKAWTAAQSFRTFAMTSDLFLTQERYCESNPAQTCWQPNASNNGRFLEMAVETLYYPCEDTIYLLGGMAPFELEDRGHVSIRNLHTVYGKMNLMVAEGTLRISWEQPVPAGIRVILPNWLETPEVTVTEPVCSLSLPLVMKRGAQH